MFGTSRTSMDAAFVALAADLLLYVVGDPSNGVNVCHYPRAITGIGVGRWGIPALRVDAPNVFHGAQRG